MTPHQFMENFGAIAEAPDGIDKLRGLVLDLALRGRLEMHDAGARTADEVVQRCNERGRELLLCKEMKPIRTSPIDERELPFDVPEHWSWARLGRLVSKLGAGSTPLGGKSAYVDDGVPFLRSQNVWNDGLRLDGVAHIPPQIHERMSGTVVRPRDVLLNITGASIARSAFVPETFVEGNVSQHVAIVRPLLSEMAEFLHLVLISPYVYERIMGVQVGISREGLSIGRLKEFPIPLPPLAEQKRIVAKVDQLMAMLDDLEQRQEKKRTVAIHVSKSSLDSLVNAADPDQLARAWDRVSKNFDVVMASPQALEDVEGAVSLLALRGRLTSRGPARRTGSETLEAIAAIREEMVAQKVVRRRAPTPVLPHNDVPWAVPTDWTWCRLGELCLHLADGPHFSPSYVGRDEGVPFLSTRNVSRRGFVLDDLKYVSHADHQRFCERIRPQPGDVIYTKGGTTGVAVANRLDLEFSVWVHLAVLRIPTDFVLPEYLSLALNSPHCYAQSQTYTHGTGNRDLGLTRMVLITLPLPPYEEQMRIVKFMDRIRAKLDRLSAMRRGRDAASGRIATAI